MPKFHFFTDVHLLNAQQASEAYGPVSGALDTEYRTTSLHTATTNPKAYAVCDGIVLVQQDSSNSNLVNLIIKPENQGSVSFINVKFFVYRGILKSSLIDPDDIRVAPAVTNDLTLDIWNTQNALNASYDQANGNPPNTTSDEPSKKALGIHYSASSILPDQRNDSDLIDTVFFNSSAEFKMAKVSAGWHIGDFEATGFGFEILVDGLGFAPIFSQIRTNENKITSTVLPTSPTQLEVIQNNAAREKIFNYIDPCAFYGLHFNTHLFIHDLTGTEVKKSGNEIYDDVLSKFNNKDIVYLDIRNENGLFFNYYNNYSDDINLSYDQNIPSSLTPFRTNGWPIKIIRNTDFAANNDSSKNIVRIAMPQGDNTIPLFYLAQGQTFKRYPKVPKNRNKFVETTFQLGFTDELQLASPNRAGQSNTTSSSWYIKIYYIKRNDPNAIPGNSSVVPTKHYLDNLFAPVNIPVIWDGTANIKYISGIHEKFLDAETELGFAAMMETGVAFEQNRVVFYANPLDAYKQKTKRKIIFKKIKGGSTDKLSFFDVINDIFTEFKLLKKQLFFSNSTTGSYLEYDDGSLSGENIPIKENFFSIGMSKIEYDSCCLACSSQSSLHPSFLIVSQSDTNNDNNGNGFLQLEINVSGLNSNAIFDSTNIFTALSGDGILLSTAAFSDSEDINIITDLIEFDKLIPIEFTPPNRVIKRLSIFEMPKIAWELYNLDGSIQNYLANEVDYAGNSIEETPIYLPVGTRVVILGRAKKAIANSQTQLLYIVCWHQGKYREGFINEKAFVNSTIKRVNYDEDLSKAGSSSILSLCFLDEASHIINYLSSYFTVENSIRNMNAEPEIYSRLTNEIFSTAQNNFNIIKSYSLSVLSNKLFNLSKILPKKELKALEIGNIGVNSLNIPDTIDRWLNLSSFKPLFDNISEITTSNFKTFILQLNSIWIDYWKLHDIVDLLDNNNPHKTKFENFYNDTLNNLIELQIFVRGNVHSSFSGESINPLDTNFTKVQNALINLRTYLINRYNINPNEAINQSPEAVWLRSISSSDIYNATRFLEVDTVAWLPEEVTIDYALDNNYLYAENVSIDNAIGYLDSIAPFSILLHEFNVQTTHPNEPFGDDTHLYYGPTRPDAETEFNTIVDYLKTQNSALNYFCDENYNFVPYRRDRKYHILFQYQPTISLVYLAYYLKWLVNN